MFVLTITKIFTTGLTLALFFFPFSNTKTNISKWRRVRWRASNLVISTTTILCDTQSVINWTVNSLTVCSALCLFFIFSIKFLKLHVYPACIMDFFISRWRDSKYSLTIFYLPMIKRCTCSLKRQCPEVVISRGSDFQVNLQSCSVNVILLPFYDVK